MRPLFQALASGKWVCALLLAQAVLATGCATPKLWQNDTFARAYAPADPPNLHLYYSTNRQDILVSYNEVNESDGTIRPRCYWLGRDMLLANPARKPHFVPVKTTRGLIPIPISESATNAAPPSALGFCAVAGRDDNFFTLCSCNGPPDPYELPAYRARSQRVKQVMLTPLAAGFDATLISGVFLATAIPVALAQALAQEQYSFRP
jgi:hypothetical protein